SANRRRRSRVAPWFTALLSPVRLDSKTSFVLSTAIATTDLRRHSETHNLFCRCAPWVDLGNLHHRLWWRASNRCATTKRRNHGFSLRVHSYGAGCGHGADHRHCEQRSLKQGRYLVCIVRSLAMR